MRNPIGFGMFMLWFFIILFIRALILQGVQNLKNK